ncbi:hypothetical protein SOV_45620 [Sporomusa ovata DSM 2662]|uniref:Uncharacterized protein n=1 Tax=Sporomusa ovata TaxID=2378 RepID=A0A0U1KUV4_9FIRM|nr:hypothetical protein [Sporomusa ovata]EQB26950.1 hypothetical protein SOV_3c08240 [Sporomusa ovata DSM 2662]CQR71055.1 hypothetical protein SpAn4DRAFT_2033 [Sporomusa ovata]
MKRKFFVLLLVMTFISAMSLSVLAAPDGALGKPKIAANELEQITAEILTFMRDEPTGGKTITTQELEAILAPYRSKMSMDGTTFYNKTMHGDFVKKEKWTLGRDVKVDWMWGNSTSHSMLFESLTVAGEAANVGVIDVRLHKEDEKFIYMYSWIKWDKTGELIKMPKMMMPGSNMPGIPGTREEEKIKQGNAVIYDDQTVAEQLCKVYRIGKTYHWFSTKKGYDIMTVDYGTRGKNPTQQTNFIYDMMGVNKDNTFFDPPADVKFSEQGGRDNDTTPNSDEKPAKKHGFSLGNALKPW